MSTIQSDHHKTSSHQGRYEEVVTILDRGHHRIPWHHILSLLVFVAVGTSALCAQSLPATGRPVLAGEDCRTDPAKGWALQEKWVWSQVCRGTTADFNIAEGYGGSLDPKKMDISWPTDRVLRQAFLEAILLYSRRHAKVTKTTKITYKNNLEGYLANWRMIMKAEEATKTGGYFVAQLPQPVRSLLRHEYSVCLMLELLGNRLEQMEGDVKDINPGKDLGPFSKAYSEAMTFMDATYIFLRALLDDVTAIIEYFYKSNKALSVPQSFDDLLKKAKAGKLPEELALILQPCQEWFPQLRDQRDDIVHRYETNLIGFVLNPKKRGWTSVQFSGRRSRSNEQSVVPMMRGEGVGIHAYLGLLLANYQRFIDDLLDLWDRKFYEWYGIVSSHKSRPVTMLEGRSANILLWAHRHGGYTNSDMSIDDA